MHVVPAPAWLPQSSRADCVGRRKSPPTWWSARKESTSTASLLNLFVGEVRQKQGALGQGQLHQQESRKEAATGAKEGEQARQRLHMPSGHRHSRRLTGWRGAARCGPHQRCGCWPAPATRTREGGPQGAGGLGRPRGEAGELGGCSLLGPSLSPNPACAAVRHRFSAALPLAAATHTGLERGCASALTVLVPTMAAGMLAMPQVAGKAREAQGRWNTAAAAGEAQQPMKLCLKAKSPVLPPSGLGHVC